jgi:hypothetical protein
MPDSNELKSMIEAYFANTYKDEDSRYIVESIRRNSLKANIETLLTRDSNLSKQIKQLEEIKALYDKDILQAYQDAYKVQSEILKEEMTKRRALEVLKAMTIEEIIDFECDER